jgi:heat-inducible transcriptional repressor
MSEPLGDRRAAVLRAIVREFIRTGEPVGSRHLLDRARLDVSPATVRNEMARLEELGYLAQPHTSAGRVPTEQGYRFVVDELREPRPLAEGQRRAIAEELAEGEPGSVDELLRRASDLASRFTHHAAAVLSRRSRPGRLRRFDLFSTGGGAATLVLIAENGRVEQRRSTLAPLVTPAELESLSRRLATELEGSPLDRGAGSLDARAKGASTGERPVLEGAAAALRALAGADQHIVVGGVANLASEDFERGTLRRLYEALEHQTAVLELLASVLDDEPFAVRIGSELPGADFRSCSLVVARFGGADADGSVSVLGPTRMDYERVISTAHAVARTLEQTLGTAGTR